MSLQTIQAVHQSRLEPRLRHLAQTLAFYADDQGGQIWPSLSTLANNMGVSDRAVRFGLKALITKGVLERDGFHGHVRRFRFNTDRLATYQRGEMPETARQFSWRQGGNCVPGSNGQGGNCVPGLRRNAVASNPERSFREPGTQFHLTRNAVSADLHDLQDLHDLKPTGADAPACSCEEKTAEKAEEKTEERKRQFCDDCQCLVDDWDAIQHYRKRHVLRIVEAVCR